MLSTNAERAHLCIEVIGWYGVAAIFAAYVLVTFDIITPDFLLYPVLNLTGAAGIAVHSIARKDYQPALLNVFWLLIAAVALFRSIL